MALTGRAGLIALIGALIVLAAPAPALAIAAVEGAVLLGVVVDLALAGSVRALEVSRHGDTSTRLDSPAQTTLLVANPGRRRLRGVLRDGWAPSAGAAPRRHRIDVPPGERRRTVTTLTPTRRGERHPDRVTVRSVGPLGLAARQGSHTAPGALRVLPSFASRRLLPAKLARLRELDGRAAARVRGRGVEFDSLRDYVVGDDVRSVDWRATARRREVVVRTWRPERDKRVMIVLDTGRTSAARVGGAPRLDTCLDAALLLGALASRAGDRVGLLAIDNRLRASVDGGGRADVLPAMVTAVAPLEAALVETDARLMVSEVLRRQRRRCLVVLLTALDAAPLREGLLPVLGRLTARHAVVLASVGDPEVAAMAACRSDAAAVYGAAAAERALAQREGVTAELRRRGVVTVDAAPDEFAGAVADAYLDLKAAGRL